MAQSLARCSAGPPQPWPSELNSLLAELLHWRRFQKSPRGLLVCLVISCAFLSTAANPLLCSTARYHCKNGLCIDKSFLCDGQNNCQDNSDEESCESSQGRSLFGWEN